MREYSEICARLMMSGAGTEFAMPPELDDDEYPYDGMDKDYGRWLIQGASDDFTEACDGFDPSSGDCASPMRPR